MKKLVLVIVIAALGYAAYQRRQDPEPEVLPEASALEVETADVPVTPQPQFRCDGRIYCSQMTSCAEATYFLQNCPGVKMDGEGDGVPCEKQWCGHH